MLRLRHLWIAVALVPVIFATILPVLPAGPSSVFAHRDSTDAQEAQPANVVTAAPTPVETPQPTRHPELAAPATGYESSGRPQVVNVIGATMIAVGEMHSCALTSTGGVKCWGNNYYGQLGDNTTQYRTTPVDVSGLNSGAVAITAGTSHTCALTASGGVKCWGANDSGQLGDGTTSDRLTPVDVSGLTSGVIAITAGQVHTCALTSSGGIKCWGANWTGQLGDGTTTWRYTPVDVSGLTTGVTNIDAGDVHTCAVLATGGVKCWGLNDYGALGDGTTTSRLSPVNVNNLSSGVTKITAGNGHTCALINNGGARCWGANGVGELGDGTTINRLTPVEVGGLTNNIIAITAGGSHTCAVSVIGGAKCWGWNYYGQLGDGSTNQRLVPSDVTGLTNGVTSISAGWWHTCALISGGNVKCWGSSSSGQLGDGTTGTVPIATGVIGLSSSVTAVVAGIWHTCALTSSESVKCWGSNYYGALGDGTTTNRFAPIDVIGLASNIQAIGVGGYHTCALTTSGGVKCWGDNQYGQLGDGTTTTHPTPVDVSGLTSGVVAIAASFRHTCALTTNGGVKCWGYNFRGQLGDGTTTNRSTPVDVSGLTNSVRQVSVGWYHSCAITNIGQVKCWGYNVYGQLGDGTVTNRLTPVDVSGLAAGISEVGVGVYHTCARTSGGGIKCWGSNWHGVLGDGTATSHHTPVDVVGFASGALALAVGGDHGCALTNSSGIKCWGSNYDGQIGDNTTADRLSPVDVISMTSGISKIAAGGYHSCALTNAHVVKCWGNNTFGQLGNGLLSYSTTAVDVVGFGSIHISGRVVDVDNNPIAGVTIWADSNISATTDVHGIYDLSNLITGTYILTPTRLSGNSVFSPITRTVGVPPNATAQDFTDVSDIDGDGLYDYWETRGRNGVDLPAMGADPNHKDIFVEVDYMEDRRCIGDVCVILHSHKPKADAIALVVQAFKDAPVNNPDGIHGINLHVDFGSDTLMKPDVNWGNLSGSSALADEEFLTWTKFNSLKQNNFDPRRNGVFHYVIFAHHLSDQPPCTSGLGYMPGWDFIVSLAGWGYWLQGGVCEPSSLGNLAVGTSFQQAGTFMHELGHNLGLNHGGGDPIIGKPNYLSVMNYAFQTRGLIYNTNDSGTFDYSRSDHVPNLVESNLDETIGLNGGLATAEYGTRWTCPAGEFNKTLTANGPIDWNCNGNSSESSVSANINNGQQLTCYQN